MRFRSILFALPLILSVSSAQAGNDLVVSEAKLDPPTVVSLGVQLLVSGDDDFDATVDVRYRKTGTTAWKSGPALFRVHPETVTGRTVPAQFAGSLFDLAPDTSYDIELHAVDPDGLDKTVPLTGKTRPVPAKDPKTPSVKNVTDTAGLKSALAAAKAGDVITLAKGTYSGPFSFSASGTLDNPIVIRGADEEGVVLDGGGCTGCNVVEIYGSFVTLERLTITNGERAIRYQTAGAEGHVIRRVHVKNVVQGMGTKPGQKNFYVCDNIFEGRLSWPLAYGDDGGMHASDEGIFVSGSGHVVCHNRVSGFGDALNSAEDGARSVDYYGNDILFTYDDGMELDGVEGNGRCYRNRFTNTWDTFSFQPIFGGPVYVMRNEVFNVRGEGFKLHALGTSMPEEPNGVLFFHNTFVKAGHAIQLSTPNVAHHYRFMNNLFIGAPTDGKTVEWDTPIDFVTGVIDYNGYHPDGKFEFGYGSTGKTYSDFASVQAEGRYEKHGLLVGASPFASGATPPADAKALAAPADLRLAMGSKAIDRGVAITGLNDGFAGTAPDLGAIELGCGQPTYGPRPEGVDESNETSCGTSAPGDAGPTTDAGTTDGGTVDTDGGISFDGDTAPYDGGNDATAKSEDGGCGCHTGATDGAREGTSLLLIGLALLRSRRCRRASRSVSSRSR
jgi:hypothetical protein